MSNEIKVKVSYEKVDCSKITSLLHELDKAKEVREQTVAHNTPLIEASGEALYNAICEQLEPITSAMHELLKRRNVSCICIGAQYEEVSGYQYFTVQVNLFKEVTIRFHNEYKFSLSGRGWDFSKFEVVKHYCIDKIHSNVLLNWNQHQIINKLMQCLESEIQKDIDEQTKKTVLSNATLKQFGGE